MTTREKVIKNVFNEVYPISDRSFHLMTQVVHNQTIAKNEVFIHRDRRNEFEYFILGGVCRSYLLNPDGHDITISFFRGPTVLTPHITRTKNEVSLLNFQAITDLEVAYFSEKALVDLMIDNLEIRFFANTVLQNELIRKVEKEIGLASLTAKERLVELRATHQNLENEVPHPMIASYLGITNVSLSRLRRELTGA